MGTALSASGAAALGAILGSFLNVVAYRLPRGESLVSPGSRCPGCRTPVAPYDNIPVVSWLVLRGRCRSCASAISPSYPAVEAATALLCALVVLREGLRLEALPGVVLVLLLVPITLIDLEHRIIPNRLTLLGSFLALGLLALTAPDRLVEHAIAGLAAGGFLLAAALAYPGGMGMGDVKLAGMLGLFLGGAVAPALLVALLAGTLAGAAVIARRGAAKGRKTAIPFGPFLAFGGLVALFAGDAVVTWYLSTFA